MRPRTLLRYHGLATLFRCCASPNWPISSQNQPPSRVGSLKKVRKGMSMSYFFSLFSHFSVVFYGYGKTSLKMKERSCAISMS